jgi:hypothetical protein
MRLQPLMSTPQVLVGLLEAKQGANVGAALQLLTSSVESKV